MAAWHAWVHGVGNEQKHAHEDFGAMNTIEHNTNSAQNMNLKDLYLITLRDCLTGEAARDSVALPYWPLRRFLGLVFPNLTIGRKRVVRNGVPQSWPLHAPAMGGAAHMEKFKFCIESALQENIPGSIVECGVWRGGTSIFGAAVLKANGASRKVYICDSFAGLPKGKASEDLGNNWHQLGDFLAVSLEDVQDNFRRHHLLDANIEFVKGWFCDTLPKFDDKIAVLRADGDMYESTMDILVNLYPKVSPGGYVIIDDYSIAACRAAVTGYLKSKNLNPQMFDVCGTNPAGEQISVYFRKE